MPLIWDDEIVRLELNDGEWVELKRELTANDDDAAFEAMVGADAAVASEDVRVGIRVTAMNRERVRRSIVAWSFTRNGQPVDVSRENIDRLDRRSYAEIVAKVDELNPFALPALPRLNGRASLPTIAATAGRRRASSPPPSGAGSGNGQA